jgi:hypothetical protein
MQPLREFLERLLQRRDLSETEARTPYAIDGSGYSACTRRRGARRAAQQRRKSRLRCAALPAPCAFSRAARRLHPECARSMSSAPAATPPAVSIFPPARRCLTAACGMPVIKHGNRSVSSRAGSADVLEALGLALPLDPEAAGQCLAATNFTFLFAPHYHPAMKALAPVRAALGVRTIFNILGPLDEPRAAAAASDRRLQRGRGATHRRCTCRVSTSSAPSSSTALKGGTSRRPSVRSRYTMCIAARSAHRRALARRLWP